MKEIVYFLMGAAAGAVVALLFAPKSGAELRADLQASAEQDKVKLQADWQAAVTKTNEQVAKLQDELKAAKEAKDGEGDAA